MLKNRPDKLPITTRRKWGSWVFEPKTLVLEFHESPTNRVRYYVDLERMETAAAMLDWIFQVRSKAWITSRDVGDLCAALAELVDPQANLCSGAMIPRANRQP